MSRPRIQGAEERIINAFIDRGFYSSHAEVISAALRLLVENQMEKDSKSQNDELVNRDKVMNQQRSG